MKKQLQNYKVTKLLLCCQNMTTVSVKSGSKINLEFFQFFLVSVNFSILFPSKFSEMLTNVNYILSFHGKLVYLCCVDLVISKNVNVSSVHRSLLFKMQLECGSQSVWQNVYSICTNCTTSVQDHGKKKYGPENQLTDSILEKILYVTLSFKI